MGKFDAYKIDLKGMQADFSNFEFILDNLFFAHIDAPEVQKGKVRVALTVKRMAHAFEFTFQTDGVVWIPCDRCLDDMEQLITSHDKLFVKFGSDYSEEGDNLIVIPEAEGIINIAWLMYEFVALAIPLKHVHNPGKCNKDMNQKLGKLLRTTDEDESDIMMDETMSLDEDVNITPIDSRWNELKKNGTS